MCPDLFSVLIRDENLYFDKRARVAEILGVLGDGVAIQAGVARVLHQVFELLFTSLLPQFAEMAPMPFGILTVGFYRFRHITSG